LWIQQLGLRQPRRWRRQNDRSVEAINGCGFGRHARQQCRTQRNTSDSRLHDEISEDTGAKDVTWAGTVTNQPACRKAIRGGDPAGE
jgi:hypothetical protein